MEAIKNPANIIKQIMQISRKQLRNKFAKNLPFVPLAESALTQETLKNQYNDFHFCRGFFLPEDQLTVSL